MIGRLANVLYWAGCVFGALFVALAGLSLTNDAAAETSVLLIVIAAVLWLSGRAARYVLAAR